jgi:hypothetical protein
VSKAEPRTGTDGVAAAEDVQLAAWGFNWPAPPARHRLLDRAAASRPG